MASTTESPRFTHDESGPTRSRADHYGPQGQSEWMDVDWRKHQHWATVLGSPVNYVDIGEGPPLIFIHGLAGSWQNWLENIPHFARGHPRTAWTLPHARVTLPRRTPEFLPFREERHDRR